ncbi:MAG: hypothetical protein ACFB4I_14900 [Cyanophyceae cyanobacterium]
MNKTWKFSLARGVVWLASEILLTLLGIDDLADYSEFIFERNALVLVSLCEQKREGKPLQPTTGDRIYSQPRAIAIC